MNGSMRSLDETYSQAPAQQALTTVPLKPAPTTAVFYVQKPGSVKKSPK